VFDDLVQALEALGEALLADLHQLYAPEQK
jgi:hypothetical protein